MKLDLMSATARPSEQPFVRPVMKTSGVGQVHNRSSPEALAMHSKKNNVNEVVLDLTSRVSLMNISTNSNAPLTSMESSLTNSNARLTPDATQPPDSDPTTHSTEDDVSSIASPSTNADGSASTGDASPANGNAENNGATNIDVEELEEKFSTLNFNIKPDAEECPITKDEVTETVDEVRRVNVEDVEVNVAAKDLGDVAGDTCDATANEKDKDDVLKRAIKVAVGEEEDTREVPAKTEVKASSGGNLCPRSPMRPEFIQQRAEPYNQTSRNAHHSGGRIVQVSTPDVTEPTSSISLHQNTWLGTCNISPFHTPADAYDNQPLIPFISRSSPPQVQFYADEGICDEDLLGDGGALADLAADEDFCKILLESVSTPDDVCSSPNGIPVASDIPESVLAYESSSPPQASWRTEAMIPSVGSSGYVSSSSPRSTSTPSPTSPQESRDPYSPVYADVEWHGTATDVYNGDDVVFDSGLLDGLDLGADVRPLSMPHAEVFQTMPCFDGAFYDASDALASSFVHIPTAVPQFHQNIAQLSPNVTQLPPNVTQLPQDITQLLPNVTQLPPNITQLPPNITQLLPNIAQLLPNITQLLPNITQLLPDLGQQACPAGRPGPAGNRVLKPIQPKPSTTARSATQRLEERLDKEWKGKIWAKISTYTDEDIVKGDVDGDTQLMILTVQKPTKEQGKTCKLEYVYALVERLKRIPGALSSVNSQQESALFLSALHCDDKDSALITRYIAEAMYEAQANVDMVYKGGDTLLHCLCRDGANRYEVLKELLSLRDESGRLYFDINKYNDKGLTPLLEAVNSHGHSDSTKSIRLLLEAGADTSLTVRDTPTTALHLAIATTCDPNLVDALLTDARLAAACANSQYREAGVLHLAAGRNDVAAERQRHVMEALVASGARREERDREGRLPWERLSAERKEAFKS